MKPRPLDSLPFRRRHATPIELRAPGGKVTIERDLNGYPTIRARDQLDATWAKGWIHARDRLGQVRLTVMGAQGRMMELLGDLPITRTVDRAVRLLRFDEGLDEHVDAVEPRSRALLEAYCAGFEEGRFGRPFDRLLGTLGIDTSPYTPRDILLVYRMISFFGLTSQQQLAEMVVAELVQDGADLELLRQIMGSAADGIDVDAIAKMRVPDHLALLGSPLGGSNAFAVGPERSASGGVLMMSEAHMEIARFPPIFYVTHEEYADGEYYQGVGIPGVPWVTMGRTRHVGWTYTFGHADNVDVLIERCKDGRYLRGDEWLPFRRRVEEVRIRGGRTETWNFWDNEFGSVLADRCDGDLACVRWTALHETTAQDVDATLSTTQCRTLDDIVQAHRKLQGISLGAILADRDGRIAYVHTGRVDQRNEGWSGAYPYAGWRCPTGTPEPLPESARPYVEVEEGFVVSANERIDGPNGERWQNFPEPPYRFWRLREILEQTEAAELRDLVAASYDEADRMAGYLLGVWAPLLPDDDDARRLGRWRGEPGDARSLALFHTLHREVVRALLETKVTPHSAGRLLEGLGMLLCFQSHIDPLLALEHPDLLDEDELRALLAVAWRRTKRIDGAVDSLPIVTRFKSIFTQGKLPAKFRFSTEPVRLPGGPAAPFQTREMSIEGETLVGGPAYHYCWDMSDDGGWYHIPGGASELPWGPGYATGVGDWLTGRFHPLGSPSTPSPDLH